MKELTKAQIAAEVFDYMAEECNIEVEVTCSEANGAEEYRWFTVKGARDWRFGLNVFDIDEENTNNTLSYRVQLYAQSEWYLNKYRFSDAPLSCEIIVPKEQGHVYTTEDYGNGPEKLYPWDLVHCVDDIAVIRVSNFGALIKYYWDGGGKKKPLRWYLEKLVYQRITKHLDYFYKNQLTCFYLNVKRAVDMMLFHHWVESIEISDLKKIMKGEVWPRYEYNVRLRESIGDYARWRIYHLITPLRDLDNTRCEIFEFGANRSFYYADDKDALKAFRDFRENHVACYRNIFKRIQMRLEYAAAYPYFWIRYKTR